MTESHTNISLIGHQDIASDLTIRRKYKTGRKKDNQHGTSVMHNRSHDGGKNAGTTGHDRNDVEDQAEGDIPLNRCRRSAT